MATDAVIGERRAPSRCAARRVDCASTTVPFTPLLSPSFFQAAVPVTLQHKPSVGEILLFRLDPPYGADGGFLNIPVVGSVPG